MARRTPVASALTRLIMSGLSFHGSLERHGVALTKPFRQTPARWQVMAAAWGEVRSVPQIARRMGLTRQAVQRIADILVAEGLARFTSNPAHRGSPILELTAKGVSLVKKINAAQVAWVNRLSRGLDQRRLMAAAHALEELSRLFDQES